MKCILILYCLFFFSCTRKADVKTPQQVPADFKIVLTKADQEILGYFPCASVFRIDSTTTTDRLRSFRSLLGDKPGCMVFTYDGKDYFARVHANLYSSGGNLSARTRLFVTIKDSTGIETYAGGNVSSGQSAITNFDTLDDATLRFLFTAFKEMEGRKNNDYSDSWEPRRKLTPSEPGIILNFPGDSTGNTRIGYAGPFLARVTQGYLQFLRQKSAVLFQKPVDSLLPEQLQSMPEKFPLYITITCHDTTPRVRHH